MVSLSWLLGALRGEALRGGLHAWWSHKDLITSALLDYVVPFSSGIALFTSSLLAICQVNRSVQRAWKGERRALFSRKGLVVSLTSFVFAISCFYRAVFVADEGAGLCRGAPSFFNAPVSGRLVATVGEIALVSQLSSYISGTARRLDAKVTTWAACRRFTLLPVAIAECFSWLGVLSTIA